LDVFAIGNKTFIYPQIAEFVGAVPKCQTVMVWHLHKDVAALTDILGLRIPIRVVVP
jgi:hypothetical protein